MGLSLSGLVTGGFTDFANAVGGVVGKFVADPSAKLAANLELAKIANDYQVQLLAADKEFAVQQANVITAEAKSESWLARNWRPILMLVITFILAFDYAIVPIVNSFAAGGQHFLVAVPIPADMWALLKLGVSGYIVGRSVEKVMETKAAKDVTVASLTTKGNDNGN